MSARPYSPRTLADRWGCSAEKVRLMYRAGELHGFTLGKLIRIPANEVERFECQNTPSQDTEANGPSHTGTGQASAAELRLVRPMSGTPNQSGEPFGVKLTPLKATEF